MATVSARFTTVPGTEAAEGIAGDRSVVVDRPAGVAGGLGLGFTGGQLLALAVGGCLANDLRYVAHARGVTLGAIAVNVDLVVDDGEVSGVSVAVDGAERELIADILDESVRSSTIVHAVMQGAPVKVSLA